MRHTKENQAEATARLREWLRDGDTLYFILRHRSESGLQRVYSVKQLQPKRLKGITGNPVTFGSVDASDLSSNIAMACKYAWSDTHYGVKINGCGFSGEQEIADTVGRLLGIKLHYETL